MGKRQKVGSVEMLLQLALKVAGAQGSFQNFYPACFWLFAFHKV